MRQLRFVLEEVKEIILEFSKDCNSIMSIFCK